MIKTTPLQSIRIGYSHIEVDLQKVPIDEVALKFERRGLFSPEILAEYVLSGVNVSEEAEKLGVSPTELGAMFQAALDAVDPVLLKEIQTRIDTPFGKGELDIHDPDYKKHIKTLGIDKIKKLSKKDIASLLDRTFIPFLLPKGPINAVDHRPFLGDARNQGGRGTCTSFGSTAVSEALEYFRDPRTGPRDFSEQLIFWYSKSGQLYTGGGYGCGAALRHHSEYGTCEEFYFPYDTRQLDTNHAHVPMPDEAMDRAQFFRTGSVVSIPARDVEALKDVLRSGRCAGIIHDATDWNTATGTYTMPDPLDSKGIGGNHCTSIIGFIDRDDLPEEFEGGYFIERNSWGGAGSTTNVMGPEYGGHLLMPYGWYRRYTHSAYTLTDKDGREDSERQWLVEYFANENLQGAPIVRRSVSVNFGIVVFNREVTVPDTVDELDFDWGSGSTVLRYSLDLPFPWPDVDVAVELVPEDHFSVRFTKVKRFRNGWYRFALRGDDGIRLWVDDTLVINSWKNQAATEYTRECYLTGGDHVLRVEYYERTGQASVRLDVQPINFHYQLFDHIALSGSPDATFNDTATDLEWRHAPPVASINQGQFSLRGTAELYFREGDYRFHAIHTGGCRIYVDDNLVLDDWSGTAASGPTHHLSGGLHEIKVEFKQEDLVPAPGVRGYYRAALNFGWSEEQWTADFYRDSVRESLFGLSNPEPDHSYMIWRTLSLTDDPIYQAQYAAVHTTPGEYETRDGLPLVFKVGKAERFSSGIAGAPDLTGNFLSVHLRRKIFIEESGWYNVKMLGGAGSRIVIDAKQILEDHVGSSPKTNDDIFLKAGVHDVAIEWAVSKWGKKIDFRLDRVKWQVEYYDGRQFSTFIETKHLNNIGRIIAERPTAVGATDYSVRAKRTISLSLGKYRFQVRTDDGARLKINGITKIDAWTDQAPKNYLVELEHRGGNLALEIEYYQKYGGANLEFEFQPIGYYGEYYKGINLEKPALESTLDRNVPVAYRFETDVNFDWGGGNRLDRVGSNNFSARWRGRVDLPVGRWQVDLTSDDGVRLFVDGRLLIDEWHTQAATTHSRKIDLTGRNHDIKVEYFEKSGQAVCRLKFLRIF